MAATKGTRMLRLTLLAVGVIFLAGLYPLTILWPSGWAWHHGGSSMYLQMIIGLYATLGIFLILASRQPLAHRSLIWFVVWSSVVHADIMAVQSFAYPEHRAHLYGDVPALFIIAGVLAAAVLSSNRKTQSPDSLGPARS